ncbi:GNAT family N-acetyltransferase [Agreia sp. COWG]|uniref:GNAT family N-acetyltransferase n=1 Tax=Agreia sp. COWG TaxID=2773266 RepID=UPI0019259531|nr:GNAT family N-acetyltransferase [Agreia sp. COWG]CAD5992002.1 Acetyltransferase (GNAT) family protein [Agreia sp. COWG]
MPEATSVTVHRVDWDDPRAVRLRAIMDAEMQVRYGNDDGIDPEKSAAINRALAVDPDAVVETVLLHDGDEPVAHAALRRLETPSGTEWEVKRVIVDSSRRGRGLGRTIMGEIIATARSKGASRLILQSGDRQPEAARLYTGLGFTPIPVYAPYAELMPQSLCFELILD